MQENAPQIVVQVLVTIFIVLLMIGFIVILILGNQKKKILQEQQLEALKSTFEKDLLQTRLEIQETVLTNVAMEIHDNIGQVMLLVNVNNSILQTLPLQAEASIILKENKQYLSKAMEDISQLSRSLHTDRISDIGVFKAIRHELGLLDEKKICEVVIEDTLSAEDKIMPQEAHIILFRMYQEIVKNILKHAGASKIAFRVAKMENELMIQIEDNGKGFLQDGSNIIASNGVGLRSLQSRIELIKGRITINSTVNKGTTVSIFVPQLNTWQQ